MKLIKSLVPLCALLAPCAVLAGTFEGKVTMSVTTGLKDGPQTVNYSIKEGYLRVDTATAKGGGAIITDFKNKQILILMEQQHMYMVKDLNDLAAQPRPPSATAAPTGAAATGTTSFKDTGVKETILGYPCEKYEVTSPRGTTEIWATDQLGTFAGLSMAGGPGRHGTPPPAWESVIKGSGFFPMRVVSADGKGFRLEVTSVEKASLPDSLFMAPEGWRKLDLGAMMGGALQGGFPGAKPADGNN